MRLYQVTLPKIKNCDMEVRDGVVTNAYPHLKQSVGLRFDKVKAWVEKRGGIVQLVIDSGRGK